MSLGRAGKERRKEKILDTDLFSSQDDEQDDEQDEESGGAEVKLIAGARGGGLGPGGVVGVLTEVLRVLLGFARFACVRGERTMKEQHAAGA